jgi:hypothetical protein
MLTALFLLVIAIAVLVAILLVVVVAGIHREPSAAELTSRAPSQMASLARRLVGVYIRRPDPTADNAESRDACPVGHATSHEGE